MKHGDLSNMTSPVIAFNADNLLFKNREDKSIVKTVLDKFKSEEQIYLNRDLDHKFLDLLERIWLHEVVSIHLVSFQSFAGDIEDYAREKGVLFTSMYEVKDFNEFILRVRNRYMYYFDNDTQLLSKINCKNAMHIDDIKKIIK